jgi:hypothetical protein
MFSEKILKIWARGPSHRSMQSFWSRPQQQVSNVSVTQFIHTQKKKIREKQNFKKEILIGSP